MRRKWAWASQVSVGRAVAKGGQEAKTKRRWGSRASHVTQISERGKARGNGSWSWAKAEKNMPMDKGEKRREV